MTEWQVLFYHYEFKTKPSQTYSAEDIISEFNYQLGGDAYDVVDCKTEEEAEQVVEDYIANHMIAPYRERTNTGLVVSGEMLEIVERVDGEIIWSNLYTKGDEDKGAE